LISLSTKLSFPLSVSGVESTSAGCTPLPSSAEAISAKLSYVPEVIPGCTCRITSIVAEAPGAIGPAIDAVIVDPPAHPLVSFGLSANEGGR